MNSGVWSVLGALMQTTLWHRGGRDLLKEFSAPRTGLGGSLLMFVHGAHANER